MIIPSDAEFTVKVTAATEILRTIKNCDKACWKCWVSWNPIECEEQRRYALDVLDELPWIED